MKQTDAQRRQGTKIAQTIAAVNLSRDHRKHRRWINLVVVLTRSTVRQSGVTHTSPSEHRRQMKRFHHRRYVPNRRPA